MHTEEKARFEHQETEETGQTRAGGLFGVVRDRQVESHLGPQRRGQMEMA